MWRVAGSNGLRLNGVVAIRRALSASVVPGSMRSAQLKVMFTNTNKQSPSLTNFSLDTSSFTRSGLSSITSSVDHTEESIPSFASCSETQEDSLAYHTSESSTGTSHNASPKKISRSTDDSELSETDESVDYPQWRRRSRWDDYEATRRSSSAPNRRKAFTPLRTRSVSVKYRGDDSLIQNDKEFQALKEHTSPHREWNKRFPEGTIVVYTDGSCVDNSASGFGVYFGPDHELNRSERIIGPIHNSGLAEILAAQMALRTLRSWRGYRDEPVILRTDFLPLVRAMSSGSNDGRFANEIETVRDLARKFPKGVEFQHVYAHDDDPGNEQADALARIATADARRARSVSAPRGRSWSRTSHRNRERSRRNDRQHVRSHSAFVAGRRR
ncbi:hypothetical protein Q1695_003319 [Nippostrongylus brasiliensis]|nr:hypothetical protein Q1695_003319 [Nippostrongylus brasiliensis]